MAADQSPPGADQNNSRIVRAVQPAVAMKVSRRWSCQRLSKSGMMYKAGMLIPGGLRRSIAKMSRARTALTAEIKTCSRCDAAPSCMGTEVISCGIAAVASAGMAARPSGIPAADVTWHAPERSPVA